MSRPRPAGAALCLGWRIVLLGLVVFASACSGPAPVADDAPLSLALPDGAVLLSDAVDGELRSIVLASATDRLEVRLVSGLDAGTAERLLSDRYLLLDSVFQRSHSSHSVGVRDHPPCPRALRPVPVVLGDGSLRGHAYSLPASSLFAYGGCTAEEAGLRSLYANVLCEEAKVLAEIRFFTPPGEDQGVIQALARSIACVGTR